jgi:hypothetical protein
MPKGKAGDAVDEPVDDERPSWVSQRAVAWVLDDAPVPVELLPALIAVARRCDENGKGSRQTASTIGVKIGKSKKQVQRDLVRLRELGLLLLGNQSLVAHLSAGQRPTVYDLPLHLKGDKPLRESKNPTGAKKTHPIHGTTPLEGAPPMDGVGGTPLDGGSTPPMDGVQKNPLNKPKEQPSLSAREPTASGAVKAPGERDDRSSLSNQDLPHRLLATQGVIGDEADRIIDSIVISNSVRSDGFWRTVDRNGDLPALIEKTRAAIGDTDNATWPDHCGECDQNRQIQVEGGYGQGIIVARCPRCHPLAVSEQMSSGARKAAAALRLANQLDSKWQDPPDRRPVITGVLASQVSGHHPFVNPADPLAYHRDWNGELPPDLEHERPS